MTTCSLRPLQIRQRLGRKFWSPPEPFGPAGWLLDTRPGQDSARIIVTSADWDHAGITREWIHASISRPARMPDYDDLKLLHHAVWTDGYAYQVFARPSDHVNRGKGTKTAPGWFHGFAADVWQAYALGVYAIDTDPVLIDRGVRP